MFILRNKIQDNNELNTGQIPSFSHITKIPDFNLRLNLHFRLIKQLFRLLFIQNPFLFGLTFGIYIILDSFKSIGLDFESLLSPLDGRRNLLLKLSMHF